jgi:hypothetical protein
MNVDPVEASEPPAPPAPDDAASIEEDDVLVVRRGPGANCSSIGSALDILFVTATIAGAVLAAATAALAARAEERAATSNDRAEDERADAR